MISDCEMSPLSSPSSPSVEEMTAMQCEEKNESNMGQEQRIKGNICLSGGSFIDNSSTMTDTSQTAEDLSQNRTRESPRPSHLEIKALPEPRRASPILVQSSRNTPPKSVSPYLLNTKQGTGDIVQPKQSYSPPRASPDFTRKSPLRFSPPNISVTSSLKLEGEFSTMEAHPSTLPTTLPQVQPQKLSVDFPSSSTSYSHSKRRFSSPYPLELQMNLPNLPRKHSLTQSTTSSIPEDCEDFEIRGIKREAEDEVMCVDIPKRTFSGLPVINNTRILDVLQQQIKIPDSQCPGLLPIPQSVLGINLSKNIKSEDIIPDAQVLKTSKEQITPETAFPGCSIPAIPPNPSTVHFLNSFSIRKEREFIPEHNKDNHYWDRRRRNNEAARRSREKRRYHDMMLEQRIVELYQENHWLKAQLAAVKDKIGIDAENIVDKEEVMKTMPTIEQILTINKCTKLAQTNMIGNLISPQKEASHSPNVIPFKVEEDVMQSLFSPPIVLNNESRPYYHIDEAIDMSQIHCPTSVCKEVYKPTPLNLSIRRSSSISPTPQHQEYSSSDSEFARSSPLSDSGFSLPHKLRHKVHLSENDGCMSPQCFKPVQCEETVKKSGNQEMGDRFTYSPEYTHRSGRWSPMVKNLNQQQKNVQDSTMKSEIDRLASEVAKIQTLLNTKSQTDCDSSNK
ncbi:unnamed protein product [Meganyctiphanes norvegica]|uniref:BZIP domain-containing protein n=1 Tax=Meganyctiphanes norvegica TaxID=48144 RepID=A0AAV2RVC0_MEGNR